MKFTLYILYSEVINRYFIGHTSNIEDQLIRHNKGKTTATASGVPWVLKYTADFRSKPEAYQRETEIKNWKSRKLIEELIEKGKRYM